MNAARISSRDCLKPAPLSAGAMPGRDRHRYETVDGKLRHIIRVTEPSGKRWWQFWRAATQEREYLVEAFSGRMTPLCDSDGSGEAVET